jgi:hypothetical protein
MSGDVADVPLYLFSSLSCSVDSIGVLREPVRRSWQTIAVLIRR